MQIPFVDLRITDQSLERDIHEGIQQVIRATAFAGGSFVAGFESDFAAFCECEFASGVGNGTEALWLALAARGIGPGDEVITVPNTFIATVEAISMCGATPVFVDIDERTQTMDPAKLEAAITPRTKAIIPVHLYGQPADMDAILAAADRHGLFVVEDSCQAHGATYKGRKAGSLGHAGCFSFYPTKNLGAFGEGGAVVTNDRELKQKIDCLREHGQTARYQHKLVGWNARMDGIQGAVLKAKLKRLSAENDQRRAKAALYGEALAGISEIIPPFAPNHVNHVYHLYVIRTKRDRAGLMQHLNANGIGCLIHYPTPVHLQPAYAFLGLREGSFPVAETCAAQILSLPMFPNLDEESVLRVAREIQSYFAAKAP